ncbi:MAG: NUDIX domain-containing protein [Isosphaeraceae bacterium]
MTTIHERSAGVIPFRIDEGQKTLYLVLHSATVRNPRAKWEFPKGGMEAGETARETAAREFLEETGLTEWSFRDGFERSLSYTYIRRGRKVIKTVTYYLAEVRDLASLTRSAEHVEDPFGHWCYWGSFEQVTRLLYHSKIRQVFSEADAWLKEQSTEHA